MATESSVMAVIRASRPSFRNLHDKLAFAIHATFMAAGHSLIATGRPAFSDQPPSDGPEVGMEGWNELEDSYGFVYSKSHQGKKMNLLVKCLAVDDALMVDTVDLGEPQKEPLHLQINLKDYVSEDSNGMTNYGDAYKNFKGLVKIIDDGILAKAEPKVEASSSSGVRSGRSESVIPDVTSVGHGLDPSSLTYPPVFPSSHSDLYPSPGAGVLPFRGPNIGGDMLVGPNDPRWSGLGQVSPSGGGVPALPPGARYDPIGPPGVPGFEPGRFVRVPPRSGRRPHPDLEHFGDPDYI
ncbi:proteasome inhibitor subunit 1 (PI31) protein [Dioscorea alata]|uniref:Proteasome inhibitor subunit 1 (PI31) protein n=1 Tax=Dioscorea alata TaxID=55571 RepID=A0ACB7W9D1_DIOAL|nr:proteasome inhibitor subunit 1 (PI31) protein [Dioscorea alata]